MYTCKLSSPDNSELPDPLEAIESYIENNVPMNMKMGGTAETAIYLMGIAIMASKT